MTLGELLTLDAGRELDEAIAEHVMGWQAWKLNNGTVQLFSPSDAVWLPQFGKRTDEQHASCDTSCHKWSTDIAAAFAMQDELERRGLQSEYSHWLAIETAASAYSLCAQMIWPIAKANPLQRCRAALRTVMGESEL